MYVYVYIYVLLLCVTDLQVVSEIMKITTWITWTS